MGETFVNPGHGVYAGRSTAVHAGLASLSTRWMSCFTALYNGQILRQRRRWIREAGRLEGISSHILWDLDWTAYLLLVIYIHLGRNGIGWKYIGGQL